MILVFLLFDLALSVFTEFQVLFGCVFFWFNTIQRLISSQNLRNRQTHWLCVNFDLVNILVILVSLLPHYMWWGTWELSMKTTQQRANIIAIDEIRIHEHCFWIDWYRIECVERKKNFLPIKSRCKIVLCALNNHWHNEAISCHNSILVVCFFLNIQYVYKQNIFIWLTHYLYWWNKWHRLLFLVSWNQNDVRYLGWF